ncbi:Mini-ribonuclease 3 [Desulfofalx alkaliphila]|uniref:Mini-ribonuclease 3 n=1 Tax=Desulfofalx alkaliphila TaxID=105483 RepID=UPI000689A514|nr:Mini-ribonuclease 3 [Desulfofalx alkaliphila]
MESEKFIFSHLPLENPHLLPPLALAYIGDAVYEVVVRKYLIAKGLVRANKLHRQAIKYVRAGSQAKILFALENKLTDEEVAVVRRGRNAKSGHVPKGSRVMEYRHSTAFESLIGYLYLKGDLARLNEILEIAHGVIEE